MQDVRQDAAVAVVVVFARGVEADPQTVGPARGSGGGQTVVVQFDVDRFHAGEIVAFAGKELEREDAEPDQVGAVDPFEGLREDRAYSEQRRAFRGPVPEEPVPYSLPATTTSGTPAAR